MSKPILYGDGIHDDTAAIQALIDSGVCQVDLPVPEKHYLISKTLEIPSNFKLKLPRFAEIKLADNSNCFMVQNKVVPRAEIRKREDPSPVRMHYDKHSDDPADTCHDFEIEGGIWNFNNMNQVPNPMWTRNFGENNYTGHVMVFYNVRNFRLSNMTFKDPSNFCVVIDTGSYFTVENITFDFNFGNPFAGNMDGIHLNGNCHYGVIRNLQGACYDDLVALNAHEGSGGDITNIQIDGVFSENCHSAVRLLTVQDKISHITVSNVYGTYYQYCIGFTKYYPGETTGCFDAIVLENIHASKSTRLPIQEVHMKGFTHYQYPYVWIQSETVVNRLSIHHLHRREYEIPVDTIFIERGALVNNLIIDDFSQENYTDKPCPVFTNEGHIKNLRLTDITEDDITNTGVIDNLIRV